jgi:predicted MPP superfamily phosphohydrolase
VNEKSIKICLAHNPDYFVELQKKSPVKFDLSLAGHTHGGQIKLPIWGSLIYNVENRQFAEGLVETNQSSYYTSRGIGVVEIPHRINCPAEVCIFTLKAK